MRQPEIYSASDIAKWNTDQQTKDGRWIPARPMGHRLHPFLWRWFAAYGVLTGKNDALTWESDNE